MAHRHNIEELVKPSRPQPRRMAHRHNLDSDDDLAVAVRRKPAPKAVPTAQAAAVSADGGKEQESVKRSLGLAAQQGERMLSYQNLEPEALLPAQDFELVAETSIEPKPHPELSAAASGSDTATPHK